MLISLAWWNTSLSPMGIERATPPQKAVAMDVVRYLTKELRVGCLALGEVTSNNLRDFKKKLELSEYALFDGTPKKGRLQFETGMLYRKDVLNLVDEKSIVTKHGKQSFKLANRLNFAVWESKLPIHIFVSHWPSRLWCEQQGSNRHLLGLRLHDAVEEVYHLYKDSPKNMPQVILLGDYNDEPFDPSLAEQLLASRDRGLVRKNPSFMYNPFWAHLGESLPHRPGEACNSICGTYFYESGRKTKWHTYDQIIFSAAFLGGGEWELNEEYTQVIPIPFAVSSSSTVHKIFDHFPVVSVIEKREKNG